MRSVLLDLFGTAVKRWISAKLFVSLASPTGFESRQGQLSGNKEARASRDTAETTFDHDVHH